MERRKYEQIGKEGWQRHIEAQANSGESIAGYCQRAGLSESGFYLWRKRLGVGFERIDRQAAPSAELIITTPNGYRVQSASAELSIVTARKLAQC